MDWLLQNWQTIVALMIVALTVVVFALRLSRPKRTSGCGGDCGCEAKRAAEQLRMDRQGEPALRKK